MLISFNQIQKQLCNYFTVKQSPDQNFWFQPILATAMKFQPITKATLQQLCEKFSQQADNNWKMLFIAKQSFGSIHKVWLSMAEWAWVYVLTDYTHNIFIEQPNTSWSEFSFGILSSFVDFHLVVRFSPLSFIVIGKRQVYFGRYPLLGMDWRWWSMRPGQPQLLPKTP